MNLVENTETKIFGFCNARWFYGYNTQVLSLQMICKKNALKCLPSVSQSDATFL